MFRFLPSEHGNSIPHIQADDARDCARRGYDER